MKIAILGGAFDPPHLGHMLVAHQVKEHLIMDEVWLMPCYSYFPEFPIKFSHITSPEIRFKMAKMLQNKSIKVSDFEYKHNKQSRTIDTLDLLTKKYPKDEFYWIIGSDTLKGFRLWNQWKRLIRQYNIIVFPRDTNINTLEQRTKKTFGLETLPTNITIVGGDIIVSNIASTHIRKRVRKSFPISLLVTQEIKKYIISHKLYL